MNSGKSSSPAPGEFKKLPVPNGASNTTIRDLERELADYNASSSKLMPLEVKFVGWSRSAFWGLFFPRMISHTTEKILLDYTVESDFFNEEEKEYTILSLAWATGGLDRSISITGGRANFVTRLYNSGIPPLYPWIYRALLLAGILAWFLSIRRSNHLTSALIMPFILNIYLNVYFMVVISRYVHILDASIMLACLTGFIGTKVFKGSSWRFCHAPSESGNAQSV